MQPNNPTPDAMVEVTQADRDLYVRICPDMCGLILNGDLDRFEQMQAIAAHRLAAIQSAPPPVAGGQGVLRAALESLLLYADPNGEGVFDGASDIVGVKANGKIVLKGSFIATCVRAQRALAQPQPDAGEVSPSQP